jgi:serine/threonine protein kinase
MHVRVTEQNAVNAVNGKSSPVCGLGELLSVYYTLHMLYILRAVHAMGIIHADIKPDNFVIVQL